MRLPPRHRRIAGILMLLGAFPCLAGNAYLQPSAIFDGDITELVIEYDSKIPSLYALDTTPLLADFEILDVKSRVIRLDQEIENRHRMQWRLQLSPRTSGNLQVPTLVFGDQRTVPLALEVKPVPDDLQSSQEIFLEFDSEPRSPYVGQQTLLSLRLYHNTPLRIDGLSEPRLKDAGSHRDGDEKVGFVKRNGTEFRLLERQILLFPRASGTLELPPAVLRGQLRQAAIADADGTGQRKISRSSNPLRIQVRAPPEIFSGPHWLPASDLVISQRLQRPAGELRIGDSIDWNLTLEAIGLPAASLPENLLEMEAENFSVYADRATRSERLQDGKLVGRLEQRFAIIVTGAGEIELPSVSLAWWDIEADRERQARLESSRVGFVSGVDGLPAGAGDSGLFLPAASANRDWAWPLLGLLLIGGLTMAALSLRRAFERFVDPPLRRRRIRGLLKQACLQNQAARARALVIEWGRARWPGEAINGLYAVRDRIGPGLLADELAALDAVLFSAGETRWRGADFWAAVRTARRKPSRVRQRDKFPGLYPG